MTNLLETLNWILEWHQQNNPECVNLWQPGLTIAEIETMLKDLPFRLSREFYELYQWRNGGYMKREWQQHCESMQKLTKWGKSKKFLDERDRIPSSRDRNLVVE